MNELWAPGLGSWVLHLHLSPSSLVPKVLSGVSNLMCKMQLLMLQVEFFERTALSIDVKVYWWIPGMEQALDKNPFSFLPSLPSDKPLLLSKHQYPSIIKWEAVSQGGWTIKRQICVKGLADQAINKRGLLSHPQAGSPLCSHLWSSVSTIRPAITPALFPLAKMIQEKKVQRECFGGRRGG